MKRMLFILMVGALPVCAAPIGFSVGFQPRHVAGLKLWLRSDYVTAADSVAFTNWLDAGPIRNNFRNTDTNTAPIFHLNIKNGRPSIHFNGTNQLIGGVSCLTGGASSDMSLFLVSKIDSLNASVAFEIGTTPGGALHLRHYRFYPYGTDANGEIYLSNIANDRATGNGAVSANTWYIHSCLALTTNFSSSNPVFFLNGAAKSSAAGSGTEVPNIGPNTTRLGADIGNSPGEFYKGEIAEVIVFNSVLNAQDRARVEKYLSARFQIF